MEDSSGVAGDHGLANDIEGVGGIATGICEGEVARGVCGADVAGTLSTGDCSARCAIKIEGICGTWEEITKSVYG